MGVNIGELDLKPTILSFLRTSTVRHQHPSDPNSIPSRGNVYWIASIVLEHLTVRYEREASLGCAPLACELHLRVADGGDKGGFITHLLGRHP